MTKAERQEVEMLRRLAEPSGTVAAWTIIELKKLGIIFKLRKDE